MAQALPHCVRAQLSKDLSKVEATADPSRHALLAAALASLTLTAAPTSRQTACPVAAGSAGDGGGGGGASPVTIAPKPSRRPAPVSAGMRQRVLAALRRTPDRTTHPPPSATAGLLKATTDPNPDPNPNPNPNPDPHPHPDPTLTRYYCTRRRDAVTFVDSAAGARAVQNTLHRMTTGERSDNRVGPPLPHAPDPSHDVLVPNPNPPRDVLVGVDTEFGGDGKGCAVVQLATHRHMWVVDVRAAEATRALVQWVFANDALIKVGFAFRNDWRELDALMPGLRDRSTPVVDVQSLVMGPPGSGGEGRRVSGRLGAKTPGLSSVTEALLGRPLDKTCQRSDWLRRPLSAVQLRYAALDAVVLLDIVRCLLGNEHV